MAAERTKEQREGDRAAKLCPRREQKKKGNGAARGGRDRRGIGRELVGEY